MKVVYHPAVQRDVSSVLLYYDGIKPQLGDEFWGELMAAIDDASRNPGRGHPVVRDLRRVNLKRFPYHLIFRLIPGGIRITAVRHHQRHPDHGIHRR